MAASYRFFLTTDPSATFGANLVKDISSSIPKTDAELGEMAKEAILGDEKLSKLYFEHNLYVVCDVGYSKDYGGLGSSYQHETIILYKPV